MPTRQTPRYPLGLVRSRVWPTSPKLHSLFEALAAKRGILVFIPALPVVSGKREARSRDRERKKKRERERERESDKKESENWYWYTCSRNDNDVGAEEQLIDSLGGCRPRLTSPPTPCCSCTFSRTPDALAKIDRHERSRVRGSRSSVFDPLRWQGEAQLRATYSDDDDGNDHAIRGDSSSAVASISARGYTYTILDARFMILKVSLTTSLQLAADFRQDFSKVTKRECWWDCVVTDPL